VSIIPSTASRGDESRMKSLLAFKPKIETKDLVGKRFAEVMDEVSADLHQKYYNRLTSSGCGCHGSAIERIQARLHCNQDVL
jgi:hypothetical protein